jgi:hypothetical protein
MTNSVTYDTPTGTFQGTTMVINGSHVEVLDSKIASATSAPVVHFTGAFVFHFNGALLSFNKGQSCVVSAGLKAALVAAGAPITVVQ